MSVDLQSEVQALRAKLQTITAENAELNAELKAVKVTTFDRAKCLIGNVDELAQSLSPYVRDLDGDGKVDPINFTSVIAMINIFWGKIKETSKECYGKEIVVKLPEGWIGTAINAAISLIGIRL